MIRKLYGDRCFICSRYAPFECRVEIQQPWMGYVSYRVHPECFKQFAGVQLNLVYLYDYWQDIVGEEYFLTDIHCVMYEDSNIISAIYNKWAYIIDYSDEAWDSFSKQPLDTYSDSPTAMSYRQKHGHF